MLENLTIPEIDGVLLGSDWGSQRGTLMSEAVWDDLIRPGEQQEYDLIHAAGKDVWVHSCGDIQTLVPRMGWWRWGSMCSTRSSPSAWM